MGFGRWWQWVARFTDRDLGSEAPIWVLLTWVCDTSPPRLRFREHQYQQYWWHFVTVPL